jgi:monoamine oxidase
MTSKYLLPGYNCRVKVIVVGAGMSGLVAARKLHDHGVDVEIVEGRDRIGGRTHTVELAGASVDLGASWIHNGKSSPMLPLVDELGIERMPASLTPIVLTASVLNRIDGTFPDAAKRDELTRAMAGIAFSAQALDELKPGLDLDEAMGELIASIDPDVRATLGALLALNEGKDASEVDFAAFAALFFGAGDADHGDVLPRGGYRGVVDHLADGLTIHTSRPVTRVEQDDEGVRVHADAGVLTGSHALVTVPLGVLKANAIEFNPPLSSAMAAAVGRVGFGTLEKVALAYDRAFWQVDGAPTNITTVASPRPEFPMIFDYSAFYGVPVVVALVAGERGRALAAMPERERVAALHDTMRIIGGPDTPDPAAFLTTSWATDPFLLGCYSNIAAGTDVDQHRADIATLGAPHGRVLFAGEHTCVEGTSTVDSAWLSGHREADRLLSGLGGSTHGH